MFCHLRGPCLCRRAAWPWPPALVLGTSLSFFQPALAHEGHVPLPTKGATIRGDWLMLSPTASKAIGVTTAKVTLGDVERTIITNATVELPCNQEGFATTMAAGRVTRVLVQPGDRVEAGQELAHIESPTLSALQMQMLQASSEWSLAQQLLETREALGNAIAGKVLIETKVTRDSKAVDHGIAYQKLRALGLSDEQLRDVESNEQPLRSLAVLSPIGGTVAEADVAAGRFVEPTEHLFHVVERSRVWVVAEVLESDIAAVEAGDPVSIAFDALPGRTFDSQIGDVGLKVDPRRHTVTVRVPLDNADFLLQPGMFGKVEITVASARQAIVCPTEALIRDGRGAVVLKQEGAGKYLRQPVQIGTRTPDRCEVLDGLFPGDRVVTVGSHELGALFGRSGEAGAPDRTLTAKTPADSKSQTPHDDKASSGALTALGQIELPAGRKTLVSSTVEGKILQVLVERGQYVDAGTALAEVASLEIDNLYLDLLQMRLQMAFTKTALERLERLAKASAVAEREVWEMRSKHQTYHHAVHSAEQKLQLIGLTNAEIGKIEDTDLSSLEAGDPIEIVVPIRAPTAGWIVDYHLSRGQVVRADEQLFEIHDLSRVLVKAVAFEQDLQRIRLGQEVRVRLVADRRYEATANITRMSPVLGAANRVLAVWAELDNPDQRIKEGMLASVLFSASAASPGVAAGGGPPNAPRARRP